MTYYDYQTMSAAPGYAAFGHDVAMAGQPATLVASAPTSPEWTMSPSAPSAASTEAQRQQAAAALQRCYRWLETAVPVVPETSRLATALVTAVQQYQAQQYDACLAQIVAVIQTARQLRLAVPALPPL